MEDNKVPPYRQVHLDFHTSEQIVGIGVEFDPEEFAGTLERARVNSITCFARCHHGWMYYDTQVFPERRHPHLARNLLAEQIEACHARGIRVPIYITVQWDHLSANQHPEWLVVDDRGCPIGTSPYEAGFYRVLCVNSPYVEFLKTHVREVLETLPADGVFFDIVHPRKCSCRYCRSIMEREGYDPSDRSARIQFGLRTVNRFKSDMTAYVRQFSQECTIFYNAGHIGARHREVVDAYTHFELESLPSGGWGYLHFPCTVRYARNLGLECVGMTGKFHTSWGDFHSFKNRAALEYECFLMLAQGAMCSIGDQLHPAGKIDKHVYELIGSVYSEVEQVEPWCVGSRPVTEIGVFTPEEFYGADQWDLPVALLGAVRMLKEGGHQYDVVDSQSDLSRYRVLLLPDCIPIIGDLVEKLRAFLDEGGALIASFESGLDGPKMGFALEEFGVSMKGEGPRARDGSLVRGKRFERNDYATYILPRGGLAQGQRTTEHAMYMRGLEVEASTEAEVLADTILPYFDRTYEHFCSHRQTPSSGEVGTPAVVQNGRCIYFSHPIFSQYHRNAPLWCKTHLLEALKILLPEPLVRHNGPSTLEATINEQSTENRWVVHLLHYVPERRGQDFDIIEDVIPLFDLRLSIRAPGVVKSVVLVPQKQQLSYEEIAGRVEFVVPGIYGHQMIALEM